MEGLADCADAGECERSCAEATSVVVVVVEPACQVEAEDFVPELPYELVGDKGGEEAGWHARVEDVGPHGVDEVEEVVSRGLLGVQVAEVHFRIKLCNG